MLNLLNRYNHGLLAIAVLGALEEKSLAALLSGEGKTLTELSTAISANPGYLKIALRSLVALGLIQRKGQRYISIAKSIELIPPKLLALYTSSPEALLTPEREERLLELFIASQQNWQLDDERMRDLFDGPLIVFVLLALKLKSKVLPPVLKVLPPAPPALPPALQASVEVLDSPSKQQPHEIKQYYCEVDNADGPEDLFLALAVEGAELEPNCAQSLGKSRSSDFDYIYSLEEEQFCAVLGTLSSRLAQGLVAWMSAKGLFESNTFTPLGLALWQRVFNFGVMASYRPMLARFNELLFGDAEKVFARDAAGDESHLDRTLNVIGSGFQHQRFFEDFENVLIEIFDTENFAAQPRYVCDMGCGDGAFLLKIYQTVLQKTRRGKALDLFPLVLIGADYNQASLQETTKTLGSAEIEIPFLTIHADIGDPQKLLDDLATQGVWDRDAILHVRSFLDHDRPLVSVNDTRAIARREKLDIDGAYVSRNGEEICPAYVLQNLVEHLQRWSFAIGKHGLLVLEVHSLAPEVIAQWFDECENFHFDASQALSGQLLVEADQFLLAAAEAGLFVKDSDSVAYCARYPKSLPFTRITLNCFERRPYTISLAQHEDVAELLELEASWPEHLRCEAQQLADRISTCPQGVYILKQVDGKKEILAVLYSQRIANVDQLKHTTFQEFSALHHSDGDVLQLISINVRPQVQNRGLGDTLLEFVLNSAQLNSRINKVVGVTRFKSFDKSGMSLEQYFANRDAQGFIEDPIPRFHQSHGATLVCLLPKIRPDDFQNKGCGVLISYDLATRKQQPSAHAALSSASQNSSAQVWQCVSTILHNKNRNIVLQPDTALLDLGFDSLDLLELRLLLEKQFAKKIDPTFFFRHATTAAICSALAPDDAMGPLEPAVHISITKPIEKIAVPRIVSRDTEPLAIVGLSFRLPGADTEQELWDLLANGRCAISAIPPQRAATWNLADIPQQIRQTISHGGFITDVESFDASLFRISRKEAIAMDPQQRLLLETTWRALECAGINPRSLVSSKTGVFAGVFTSDYELLHLKHNEQLLSDPHFATGTNESIAAGRISYFLGLQGPALSINTACSSSLVALDIGAKYLRRGDCDLALVAGVNLLLSPELSVTFANAGMLSPDGRCATFDAAANGYVRSEGCAVVVLKRYSDALRDQDNIWALVRGSAVNQDGASNGLTAPNGAAQEAVIGAALADAGISAEQVAYVETHGTATILGDPIEVEALNNSYALRREVNQPLLLGSIKSNIGHTEATAGLAGLIKVLLAMKYECLPPTCHFRNANELLKLSKSNIAICQKAFPWPRGDKTRYAAVSSFGFSGTNAHVVLEEPPHEKSSHTEKPVNQLLVLSAASVAQLEMMRGDYLQQLSVGSAVDVSDIAFTSQCGRAHFSQRLFAQGENAQELIESLQNSALSDASETKAMAMLFTGQGAQFGGMSRMLFEQAPVFRSSLKNSAQIVADLLPLPLLEVLFSSEEKYQGQINKTLYTQPALFALEYALYEMWNAYGVVPQAVLGHSVGEYVAACVAGVFSHEAGLRLIAARAALMQSLPVGGAMLALRMDTAHAEVLIAPFSQHLSIAAVNGPSSVVISGAEAAIEIIQKQCQARNIWTHRLLVSHAFHSPLMQPILNEFEAVASKVTFTTPKIKLISNLSGSAAGNEVATPQYWVSHLREAVHFSSGIKQLCQDGISVFLELGPRPVLLTMAAESVGQQPIAMIPSLVPGKSDFAAVQESIAQLYSSGQRINWEAYCSVRSGKKTVLPGYRFAKQQFWLNTSQHRHPTEQTQNSFYQVTWQPLVIEPRPLSALHWLVVEAEVGCADEVCAQLRAAGQTVAVLQQREAALQFDELHRLLHKHKISGILYCSGAGQFSDGAAVCGFKLQATAAQLLVLQQQLLRLQDMQLLQVPRVWQLVLNGVSQTSLPYLASAAIGMQRVFRNEAAQLAGPVVHLARPNDKSFLDLVSLLADNQLSLSDEYRVNSDSSISVLRVMADRVAAQSSFDSESTYLISGASGAIGFAISKQLVAGGVRHFALCSRSGVSQQQMQTLLDLGAKSVESFELDIADIARVEAMVAAIARTRQLKGVIHAAGVVSDALIVDQSAKQFADVLEGKAVGALNLHFATSTHALTHFVCISSIASLLGTSGQVNYAAANGVLDGLMCYRQEHGMPGLSLHLGYVGESGMAARISTTTAKRIAAQGLCAMPLEDAARQIVQSFDSNSAELVIAEVDWQRYATSYTGDLPLISKLLANAEKRHHADAAGIVSLKAELLQLDYASAKRRLSEFLKNKVQSISGALEAPDSKTGFFDLGFDSYMNLRLRSELQEAFSRPFVQTIAFEYPNIELLSDYLLEQLFEQKTVAKQEILSATAVQQKSDQVFSLAVANVDRHDEPIAVIAMSCRMPGGSNSPEALHKFLRSNQCAVAEVPKLRWNNDAIYSELEQPGTTSTRFGAFINDVEYFDAAFFGVAPREALRLDPQQRLLLELAWEALENANIAPSTLKSSCSGLFIGIGQHDYAARQLYGADYSEINAYDGTGSLPCFGPGRLAHALGLQGPVMAIDTACSSSLVALHLAMQSLRRAECDLALAGGVHLILSPEVTIFLSRIGALSSSGVCRAFDAQADGYGRGEGVGLVVLKRLSDAQRDGDKIEALLVGSAVNHDGTSSGLTVPNRQAQERLLRDALRDAALQPDDVDYLEAHGTGTLLGDPIEVHAIAAAFAKREVARPLYIGSVKNNIGHLEAAAGIAGVIKVIQAMKAKELPGHLYDQLTPNVQWELLPLKVSGDWQIWQSDNKPRIAGVSSFGMSGTNAHVVIQETSINAQLPEDGAGVLLVSAKTKAALHELIRRYQQLLSEQDANWPAICATAALGRDHFSQRCAVVAKSLAQARRLFSALLADSELRSNAVFFGTVNEDEAVAAMQPAQTLSEIAQHYVSGVVLEFKELFPVSRQVRLPNYPFERQRFWSEIPPRRDQSANAWLHPLLQKQSSFPSLGNQVFESEVSLKQFPFLADHVIYDEVVVPGAFHLSLLFAAAQQLGQSGYICFEDVLFHRALSLQEQEAKHLQVVFHQDSSQHYTFELLTFFPGRSDVWTKHVTGKLNFENSSFPDVQQAAPGLAWAKRISADEFYPAMSRREIVLGKSFRWIKQAARSEQQLLVDFADPVAGKFTDYGFFPGLLDSCLQSLLAFVAESAGIFVPFAVQRLRFSGLLPTESLRADMVLHSETAREISADIVLRDDQGQLLLEFVAVDCAAVTGKQEFLGNSVDDGLFSIEWEQLQDPIETQVPTLIFGDTDVTLQDLPRLAMQQHESWALVYPLAVDFVSEASAEALQDAAVQRAAQLANFFQVVTQLQWLNVPTIVLLGLDAALAASNCASALVHRALFSFSQVVALEHPELKIVAVALENYAALEESFTRVVGLAVGCPEDHLRIVGAEVFAPRLSSPRLVSELTKRLDPDKAYLVTGAFGELGQIVIEELIAAGAQKIALLSRREITERELGVVAKFEAMGAQLLVLQADVSRREELQRCLEKVREEFAPLSAVVHTAGVLDDAMLHNLKQENFDTVMQPKVCGAYLLHELTVSDALEHFILFSSSAALLGALGQGNYGAANGFLDGLAQLRRSLGLPAVSINWGPWEAGMAADVKGHLQKRLEQRGLLRFSVERGRSVFRRSLQAGVGAQYCLQPLNKIALAQSYSQHRLPSLLRKLVAVEQVAREVKADNSLFCTLQETDSAQRIALLQQIVAQEVCRVLGSSPEEKFSYQRGFLQLGMDSLMSVELRNNLQVLLAVKLAPTVAFNYSNVEMLALHLDYKLFGQEEAIDKNLLAVEVEKVKKETVSSDNVDLNSLSLDELTSLLEAELE